MMSQWLRDLRMAARRLYAAPLFTLFAISTLAIGIGVTTAAYSFLYSLLWQPVGVRDQDRLVSIQQIATYDRGFSGPELEDLRRHLSRGRSAT